VTDASTPTEPGDVVEEAEKRRLLTGRPQAASVDEENVSSDTASDVWLVWNF